MKVKELIRELINYAPSFDTEIYVLHFPEITNGIPGQGIESFDIKRVDNLGNKKVIALILSKNN
jgi:hypothetical protein